MVRLVAVALLLAIGSVARAGDDCSGFEGTYRNESEGKQETKKDREYLDNFVRKPDGRPDEKLVEFAPSKIVVGGRVVSKRFASTATLSGTGNTLRIEFRDAAGNSLATHQAEYPYTWACKGSQFEWVYDGFSGIGDAIVETRSRGMLKRHESGDLVLVLEHRDPRNKPPDSGKEWRFRAAGLAGR